MTRASRYDWRRARYAVSPPLCTICTLPLRVTPAAGVKAHLYHLPHREEEGAMLTRVT